MIINLRPHHILCLQTYVGKGYDENFVANMNFISSTLRKNDLTHIKLVSYCDDICSKCPNKTKDLKCTSNDKVCDMDRKVMKYLNLEYKDYTYKELLDKLKKHIDKKAFKDICGNCEWYKLGLCSELVIS